MIDNPLNRLDVRRGTDLPQSKLTEDDVRFIRRMVERRKSLRRAANEVSNENLAKMLGVHTRTVEKAIQGYSWGHVV